MKFELTISLQNLDQILDKLNKAPEVLKSELNEAIKKSIKAVWTEAWERTPWRTGLLRGTYKSWYDENRLIGLLAPTREYALLQHERTDFRHPKGGEAKYLANAIKAREEEIKRNFGQAIDNTLNKMEWQ